MNERQATNSKIKLQTGKWYKEQRKSFKISVINILRKIVFHLQNIDTYTTDKLIFKIQKFK